MSLEAENRNGYLLHCYTLNALRKKVNIPMPLVIEVTDRKCKRTGRLTSHD